MAVKRLKMQHFLAAVCHITPLILPVIDEISSFLLPHNVVELKTAVSLFDYKQLELDKEIELLIETLHEMIGNLTPTPAAEDSAPRDAPVIPTPVAEDSSPLVAPESTTVEPPDSILDWDTVPQHTDVTYKGEVFLRPAMIHTTYHNVQTYRDIQFRLVMEDFTYPVRKAIVGKLFPQENQLASAPPGVYVYDHVTFYQNESTDNNDPLAAAEKSCRYQHVSFKLPLKYINWNKTRKLTHGSLVFLWDGTEEELISGTVVTR